MKLSFLSINKGCFILWNCVWTRVSILKQVNKEKVYLWQ